MTLNDRITAVHLMQRFVRMSRSLLPAFHELRQVIHPSPSQESQILRIRGVYDNFQADPAVSKDLINSDIVRMIQEVYDWLIQNRYAEYSPSYEAFLDESDRLIENWDRAMMN